MEAEKYSLEKIAEAKRIRVILKAEARADHVQAARGEAKDYAIEAEQMLMLGRNTKGLLLLT